MIQHHFDTAPSVADPAGGVLLPIVGTPDDDDVPIYNASTQRWEPGPQTGGGGGSTALPFPYEPPASPHAMDDEHPGTSLDGQWSWLNQGSATVTIKDSTLQLEAPTSTENVRALITPISGATWEIETYLSVMGADANFWSAGLVAYNSGNGRLELNGRGRENGMAVVAQRYNSTTSHNANLASSTAGLATMFGWGLGFLRIQYDGTSLIHKVSANGKTFITLHTSTVSAFLSGITDVGLFVKQSGSGAPASLVSHYFRRIA